MFLKEHFGEMTKVAATGLIITAQSDLYEVRKKNEREAVLPVKPICMWMQSIRP